MVNCITLLQKSKARIEPGTVASLGENVLSFVTSDDRGVSQLAWQTAMRLADYRTTLNQQVTAPIIKAAQSSKGYPWFSVDARVIRVGVGAGTVISFDEKQAVPFDEAARYELIDKPNVSGQPGFRFIVVTGTGVEIILDGHRLRNVVIHDVQVSYEGGPLIMENVYFANCTFNIHAVPNGEVLTAAIINSAPTSFQTQPSGD